MTSWTGYSGRGSAMRRRIDYGLEDVVSYTIRSVSESFGVSEEELLSRRRTQAVADARAAVIYILVELTPLPLLHIAKEIKRHHSTVIHAYHKADYMISTNVSYSIMVFKAIDSVEEYIDNRINSLNFESL